MSGERDQTVSAASVPRSRRERPAKPALSREWIISATIDIMRREGLAKATMRRVAQALDTGPASLYVYIANTAELHAAVLDELLGTLEVRTEGGWAERLEALLGDYRTLLFTYPGLARSAVVIRPTGSHAIVFIDRLLGLLLEGGVEPTRAAWGVDLLILHVTADAAEHSAPAPDEITSPADREAEWDAISRAIAAADPAAAPHVVAHSEAILSGRPEQRAHWALAVLIAGIAGTPVPDGPA
jgi:AcrR family transcriptional regulator